MQRTDLAEEFFEHFAKLPLTWENVFRSPEFEDKTAKEVVDLLLILRSEGIFISLKYQKNPFVRSGDKLYRWVNKQARRAFKQLSGGLKTVQSKPFSCIHPRRGKVSFDAGSIKIIHTLVLIETLNEAHLDQDHPLTIGNVPVSYFSANDFLNIIEELRTINDIKSYLDKRHFLPKEILLIIGAERTLFDYYMLKKDKHLSASSFQEIKDFTNSHQSELNKIISEKKHSDQSANIIEVVSDRLSKSLENYKEGLDDLIVANYDPETERKNYLLMQNELCDLMLSERRLLGEHFMDVINRVNSDSSFQSMGYKAAYLDSKPNFQYVFAASKGIERAELLKRAQTLLHAALANYSKSKGMVICHNISSDNFEVMLMTDFYPSQTDKDLGKQFFGNLKMSSIPVERC